MDIIPTVSASCALVCWTIFKTMQISWMLSAVTQTTTILCLVDETKPEWSERCPHTMYNRRLIWSLDHDIDDSFSSKTAQRKKANETTRNCSCSITLHVNEDYYDGERKICITCFIIRFASHHPHCCNNLSIPRKICRQYYMYVRWICVFFKLLILDFIVHSLWVFVVGERTQFGKCTEARPLQTHTLQISTTI